MRNRGINQSISLSLAAASGGGATFLGPCRHLQAQTGLAERRHSTQGGIRGRQVSGGGRGERGQDVRGGERLVEVRGHKRRDDGTWRTETSNWFNWCSRMSQTLNDLIILPPPRCTSSTTSPCLVCSCRTLCTCRQNMAANVTANITANMAANNIANITANISANISANMAANWMSL